ncbi:MAG: type III polyketide synthase [Acidobacteria bacterium]|nr:type III polyketide synthase [Acidobacteriota bacterium]
MPEITKEFLSSTNQLKNNNSFSTVLANFTPIILTNPIPQNILLDTFASLAIQVNARSLSESISTSEPLSSAQILEKIYHYGVSPKIINRRQVNILSKTIDSLEKIHPNEVSIFNNLDTNPQGKDLKERMVLFGEIADRVLEKAYPKDTLAPDDIIHVSCSGYLAPSPVEKMVSQRHWRKTTVTHSYHMGCYASVPALRMANGFLVASHYALGTVKSQIDIVHTEFLTLHVDLTRLTPRDILATTLFGDGFIKYSLYPLKDFLSQNTPGLKILALKETIIADSLGEMLWNLSSYNFEMILSKKIPFLIRDNILSFVEELMLEIGLDFAKEKDRLLFAIHPGGPKIIEFIQRSLKIAPQQVTFSHNILEEFGNMSSATLPFIWDRILKAKEIPSKTLILSIAFGPGLTAAGALMEKI